MKYIVWSKTVMDLRPHTDELKKICDTVDSKSPRNLIVEVIDDQYAAFFKYCQQHRLMISRPNKFRLLQE